MEWSQDPASLFSIPTGISYLNHAYMAPQLRRISEDGMKAIESKERPWNIGANDFFTPVEELRKEASVILGCTPNCVSLVPSVSYGVGTAAKVLPSKSSGNILLLAEQFPSNVYPWLERSKATGEKVIFVEKSHRNWTEALLGEISANTSVIAIPECHWTDGSRINLQQISAAAKDVGASLVLDLTQSLGAVPFSADAIDPDFVLAAGYKWLMGPYSLGYMYVAKRHHDKAPMENNWITRKDSHQFAALVDYGDTYEPGARRFDVGERSNFFLVPMALAGLRQINQWGVEKIAQGLQFTIQQIISEANKRGWRTLSPDEQSPHMTGIRHPDVLPEGLMDGLIKQSVYVSIRGDSIRVSPHLYTTREDISRLFSALDTLS